MTIGGNLCDKESNSESGKSKDSSRSSSSSSSDSEDDEEPEILLQSPGIKPKHAQVQNTGRCCYLQPVDDSCALATWVNGVSVAEVLRVRRQKAEYPTNCEDGGYDDEDDVPEGKIL